MILKIALVTQNKQNIFYFRLKKFAPTTANQSEEKKLIEKEKARNHMRELRLKKWCKIEKERKWKLRMQKNAR